MKNSDKDIVRQHGRYTLVEGDIETAQGGITFCWVEKDGRRISRPTDIDGAESDFESAIEDDYNDED